MMIQEFVGSTTIVPQVAFQDYFKLFSDPSLADLERYFQGGRVAAYEHTAMIKLHYKIADALDQCIAKLTQTRGTAKTRTSFTGDPTANLKALQVDKLTPSSSKDGGSCTKKAAAYSDGSEQHSFETASTDEDDEHTTGWIDL
jgi:hypothetical protein